MKKLRIKLEVGKITKSKIIERAYTNKENKEVVVKEYEFDVIVDEDKQSVVAEGETWKKIKTGFCAEVKTKEEKANKAPSVYVGSAYVFEDKTPQPNFEAKKPTPPIDDIDPESIPF